MYSWWFEYLAMAAVAAGAYAWLVLVLRISGKRTLAKLNAFDFAITVAFGSALATIVIDEHVGLVRGGLVLAVLALLQFLVTKASQWSRPFRKAVRSQATMLVRDGLVFPDALKRERVTTDDLAEAIRTSGVGTLSSVGAVVLETDGSFSVLQGKSADFDLLYDVRLVGEPSRDVMRDRWQTARQELDTVPGAIGAKERT
ncbi:DUF421 domain-containing protein [Sphingomonas sabuli]|uniref:DUF421 domain-containing protein n=1 Tax=Sphingomonas sabuli TaxID=2764186 RepID=A0A7G9L2E4_9SPHN|nr:YetF domain-containing protein [Sphingomonas sabuli]QNM82793.1 DUF421 domain-containing protein [Sphingomonas sabuli]